MDIGRVIIDTVALVFGFGWPVGLAWVITRHRQKMRELEYRRTGSPALAEEVTALRQELAQLRETTTRFDMSYDAALDRLERRMEQFEAAPAASAETETTFRASAYPTEDVTIPLRRS